MVSLPYLVHIRNTSGRWHLTKKKSVGELVGVKEMKDRDDLARERHGQGKTADPKVTPSGLKVAPLGPGPVPRYVLPEDDRSGPAPLRAILSAWEALHVVLQVLFYIPGIVGVAALVLWRRLPRGRDGPAYPLLVLGFFLALCALFHFSYHYLSDRHLCGPALAFLPFVGAGVCLLAMESARLWNRLFGREGPVPVRPALVVMTVALLVACLPKGLSSFGSRKAYLKQVGEALAAGEGTGHSILSTEMRLPYYAGGRYLPLPRKDDVEVLHRAMAAGEARLVVLNYSSEAFLRDYPRLASAFWALEPRGFERVGVFDVKRNGRPLVVLRRRAEEGP